MKLLMSKAEIRSKSNDGESPTDILRDAVASGLEYQDAVWRVTDALKLKRDEVQEMEENYMEQA